MVRGRELEITVKFFLIAALTSTALSLSLCRGQTTAPASAPNEKDLWLLWQEHMDPTNDHAAVVIKASEFITENPHDPLTPVARGIQAWHLLQMAGKDEAEKVLSKTIYDRPQNDIQKAAANIGRAWLSRIDIEKVKVALKKVYFKNIAFPENLDPIKDLPEKDQPPLQDRWGASWSYGLVRFKKVRGFEGQKYKLSCAMLGSDSDLKTSLERPYADRINMEATPQTGRVGRGMVKFLVTGEEQRTTQIAPGSKLDNIFFAYNGKNIIVLADMDHWKVMKKIRK